MLSLLKIEDKVFFFAFHHGTVGNSGYPFNTVQLFLLLLYAISIYTSLVLRHSGMDAGIQSQGW
jgi:hypothetical protein